jgi:ubiquinone/menaquinone biosynthesis C-methylase UbiE
MTVSSNWYEDFFHGLALDLWRKAISPRQTTAEADFLVRALECGDGSNLLDVPCGNGRLSLELARRGYRVTGVDIAPEFIEEARANALGSVQESPLTNDEVARAFSVWATGETPAPQFMIGDMRHIEGDAIYDGGYCFGNSFGFLAYADMESFLGGVARALKPGSRFVIETGMAAESIITKFEAESSHQIEDIRLTIKEQYLAEESCIDTEYIFEQNGKVESRNAKHWIYTAGEIRRMLERAGFEVLNLYGSLKCEPYTLGADELFVIARKSEPGAVATG